MWATCGWGWSLLTSPAFWFFKVPHAVLAPAAGLANLLALLLLRRRPVCLPVSLRPLVQTQLLGNAVVSLYLLLKSVYAFAALLLSECPLVVPAPACLIQESLLLLYICLSAPLSLALGLERLVLALTTFVPVRSECQPALRRLLLRFAAPLAVLLVSAGLTAAFLHFSEARRGEKRRLLPACSLLESLSFPLPLCLPLTHIVMGLSGLVLLAASARFALWAPKLLPKRWRPPELTQRHQDVVRVACQLLGPSLTLVGLQSLAMMAAAVQILGLRMAETRDLLVEEEEKSPRLWLYVFREGAFYTPLALGAFLYPVSLFWRIKALRRLLIHTVPSLRLDIALPILTDEENVAADLRSLHSVPDDLSRSTSQDPHLGLTAL